MDICCIYLTNTGVRVWKRNPVYKYQKLAKSTISCLYFNTSINISTFNKYQTSNQQISAKLIVKNQQYNFNPSIYRTPKQSKTAQKDPERNLMAQWQDCIVLYLYRYATMCHIWSNSIVYRILILQEYVIQNDIPLVFVFFIYRLLYLSCIQMKFCAMIGANKNWPLW